jgi:hypothetical protein
LRVFVWPQRRSLIASLGNAPGFRETRTASAENAIHLQPSLKAEIALSALISKGDNQISWGDAQAKMTERRWR